MKFIFSLAVLSFVSACSAFKGQAKEIDQLRRRAQDEEAKDEESSGPFESCCGNPVSNEIPNDPAFQQVCRTLCGGDPDDCCGKTPSEDLTTNNYAKECTEACEKKDEKSGCFSPTNTVEVQGKGLISMDSLQIGDFVSAGNDHFSRVFSFIHLDRNDEEDFLQIHADGLKTPLEITPDHMVFVKDAPVRASQVKVGDMLGKSKVSEVKSIKRRGVYAPVTESGDIVVSGVLASCYAAVLSHTPFNQHFGAHAFFSVRRLVCALNFGICESETYIDGLPDWMPLSTIDFFMSTEQSNPTVQFAAALALMPLITAAYIVEQLICSPLLVGAFILGLYAFNKKISKTSKIKVQ